MRWGAGERSSNPLEASALGPPLSAAAALAPLTTTPRLRRHTKPECCATSLHSFLC